MEELDNSNNQTPGIQIQTKKRSSKNGNVSKDGTLSGHRNFL